MLQTTRMTARCRSASPAPHVRRSSEDHLESAQRNGPPLSLWRQARSPAEFRTPSPTWCPTTSSGESTRARLTSASRRSERRLRPQLDACSPVEARAEPRPADGDQHHGRQHPCRTSASPKARVRISIAASSSSLAVSATCFAHGRPAARRSRPSKQQPRPPDRLRRDAGARWRRCVRLFSSLAGRGADERDGDTTVASTATVGGSAAIGLAPAT